MRLHTTMHPHAVGVRETRERTCGCVWCVGKVSFGTKGTSLGHLPVYEGWSLPTERAHCEQRRRRVSHRFLKRPHNTKVLSAAPAPSRLRARWCGRTVRSWPGAPPPPPEAPARANILIAWVDGDQAARLAPHHAP